MTPESSDSPSKAAPRDDSHRIKIHNWQDAVDSITDDTQLIRYMKLSAFLLLLDNRLFIPNLKLLQAQDRRESRIPQELLGPTYWQKMSEVVSPHEQALLRITAGPKRWKRVGSTLKADPRFLAERWLEELAKRRCVWCWNRSIDLLHSLWKIYGERGVAVLSTVGRIRKALEKAGARKGVISLVRYAPLRTPQQLEEVTTMLDMERSLNLRRPYLFKDAGYRIEEEVRFVLGANPMATSKPLGVLIDIDSLALIHRFVIAPDLPRAEADCIQQLANKRLRIRAKTAHRAKEPPFLRPFAKEPDLPGVHSDLD